MPQHAELGVPAVLVPGGSLAGGGCSAGAVAATMMSLRSSGDLYAESAGR